MVAMTILLATNNAHKKQEFEAIFPDWTIQTPADVGLSGWDHDETADSFVGNALGKARALWNDAGGIHPVLADDSGICVDALGGAPGIYSARYGQEEAGRKLSDTEKNQLLLHRLDGVTDRGARFVCALAFVVGSHRAFTVEESWEGQVALSVDGVHGFGYDPLFFLPEFGVTSAQLSPDQKNHLSHRYRASRRLSAVVADLAQFP
jgi:XTP/dITP diphosphohydrolase